MSVRNHYLYYLFIPLGGLFTGGMAYFVQGKAFGFDNVTILALAPPFLVGATAVAIILYLVRRGQQKLRAPMIVWNRTLSARLQS